MFKATLLVVAFLLESAVSLQLSMKLAPRRAFIRGVGVAGVVGVVGGGG